MKLFFPRYLSIVALFAPIWLNAQTNTFPSSGNAGIGTTSPSSSEGFSRSLEITGTTASLVLSSSAAGNNFEIGQDGNGALRIIPSSGSSSAFALLQNGNVGIGTTSPQWPLEVDAFGARIVTPNANAAQLDLVEANGGHDWSIVSWGSAAGGGSLPGYFSIYDQTSGGHRFVINTSGYVGIGTTNPTYLLSVNGTIQAKEVIVQSGWSDYVFAKDHKLTSLQEVDAYIKRDGHLPGIPSAREVAKNGLSVGEMQSKLLAQIEELTLHVIDQEKRLNEQATQLKSLQSQNELLLAKISSQ